MKEKYPVSGFTRDKEAIYVNGIRIFVPAEYDGIIDRKNMVVKISGFASEFLKALYGQYYEMIINEKIGTFSTS